MDVALHGWLQSTGVTQNPAGHRHRLLTEVENGRTAGIARFRELAEHAHADARERLRAPFVGALDPLGALPWDPAAEYPRGLNLSTLFGYFGELAAGVISEQYAPFDIADWEVPAYLFRLDLAAFQELERLRQGGGTARPMPGRTGDDCLAFRRTPGGRIDASLTCEAKCIQQHDNRSIADAHRKLSADAVTPVDVARVIEVLQGRSDAASSDWVRHLQLFVLDAPTASDYEPFNLLVYISGDTPARSATWIDTSTPHEDYRSSRPLEVVELHLNDPKHVVGTVYGKP